MGLRLLIVDDNRMQIDSLCTFVDFEKYGISEIETAANGLICLETVKWFKPHIIITDIEMPEMDGLEIIKALRESKNSAKIIIITCHKKFDYAKTAMEYGVDAFLLKPIEPEEICAAVEKVVNEISKERNIDKIFNESLKRYGIQIAENGVVLTEKDNAFDVHEVKGKLSEVIDGKARAQDVLAEYFVLDKTKYICNFILSTLQQLLDEKGISLYKLIDEREEFEEYTLAESPISLEEWLTEFINGVAQLAKNDENKHGKYNKISQDIKNFIDENFDKIDSVEQIAEHLGISSSYAKRVFQKTDNKTVFDYLYERRMSAAKAMLLDPYCKVYEIADKVGYKSKAYFAEAFRKYVGCTPSEYREREIGSK